jgi:hypothetical protein
LDFLGGGRFIRLIFFNSTKLLLGYLGLSFIFSTSFYKRFSSKILQALKRRVGPNLKVSNSRRLKFRYLSILRVFLTILGLNLLGLVPYVFSIRSQVVVSLKFSLIL